MQRLSMRTLRLAIKDTAGVSAVEFGVGLPVLMVLIAGTIEFSRYIGTRIDLEQALRAGAQHAIMDPTDSTTITSAVQGATTLTGVTVAVSAVTCECPNGSSTPCPGGATFPSCTGGVEPAAYVTITGTVTYDPVFDYLPWFTNNMSVQQPLTMRVM